MMMLISLLVTSCLIATSILSTTTETASVYCKTDYGCVGQAISNSGSGGIYVYGYKSASGSSTSITVSGSQERLYVQSEFGAYQLGTFTSNYYAYLNGGNAMTSAYLNSYGVTGMAACSLYDAYIQSTGGYIYCYSDMTCDSATINYAFNIQAQGSYALHSATINTDGKSLTLSLYGYYAGYNAILNCDSGDTCTINCYGNACYGLQLNCVGTCTTSCDDSTNTICPIDYGTTVPSIPNDETDYQFDIATQSLINMENCELSGATTYGDYNSAASSDISTGDGNICCQAQGSCSSIGNIEIAGNDHDIICGGQTSCVSSSIYTANSENSNVYCTGRYGCQRASIITSTSALVHCGSIQSCINAGIYYADRVYCSGNQACYGTAFYGVTSIYLTGYYAAQNAIIYSDGVGTMYIHFAAYLSGDSVAIYCDYDDYCYIYCKTNGACTNAVIYGCSNYEIECGAASGIACPTEYGDCPTSAPTDAPSASPTQRPTMPTVEPTFSPTSPTVAPTFATNAPTSGNPTMTPSNKPSEAPTIANPTSAPTGIDKPSPSPTSPTVALTTTNPSNTTSIDRTIGIISWNSSVSVTHANHPRTERPVSDLRSTSTAHTINTIDLKSTTIPNNNNNNNNSNNNNNNSYHINRHDDAFYLTIIFGLIGLMFLFCIFLLLFWKFYYKPKLLSNNNNNSQSNSMLNFFRKQSIFIQNSEISPLSNKSTSRGDSNNNNNEIQNENENENLSQIEFEGIPQKIEMENSEDDSGISCSDLFGDYDDANDDLNKNKNNVNINLQPSDPIENKCKTVTTRKTKTKTTK